MGPSSWQLGLRLTRLFVRRQSIRRQQWQYSSQQLAQASFNRVIPQGARGGSSSYRQIPLDTWKGEPRRSSEQDMGVPTGEGEVEDIVVLGG